MAISDRMTAIVMNGSGGPEVLVPAEKPVPRPRPGEILIQVHAAGVNRPDIVQRMGAYPPPAGAPDWPGLEVAGLVVAAGEGAWRFAVGDRVMALVPGGGYAEYCVADERNALAVPEPLTLVEAAGIPETFFTVWQNVFERGRLAPGETLLVHGGTSGIGTTAIQLAAAFGSQVLVTAGSAAKCEAAMALGAQRSINYREEDFVAAVGEATGGKGADVILDMVGGDYTDRNFKAAAEDGRIVQIAFLKGNRVEIDLGLLMRKRLTLTGSTLRPRSVQFKAGIADALRAKVWPLLESGAVKPSVEATYSLNEAAEAHRHMDRDHTGKIILVTRYSQ